MRRVLPKSLSVLFLRPVSALACCFAFLLGIVGCGGGGGGGNAFAPSGGSGSHQAIQPPSVQPSSIALNVLGTSVSSMTGSVGAVDPQGLPLSYAISQQPSVGTVSIDSSTGKFTYTVAGHTSATTDSFAVTVSNMSASTSVLVSVQLGIDPLLPNQWHIQNTGQNAFSTTPPTAGNDMNVAGAWAAGFSGKGIKVGIADSGLEAAHEDLAANVDLAHSFNYLTGLNDPTPMTTDVGFDHGTAVAGIIGAVAFNGKGGRGIAYGARLRGYNLMAPELYSFSVANMAKSLGSDPISADNDVFNVSFAISAGPVLPPFSPAFQSIAATSFTLRGGLGAAIVNAAGNEFEDWESSQGSGLCASANQYGVSCGDPASDERRGGFVPIIVGALDADGKHASYSNTGSSLWISAPGGEYGLDSSYVPGQDVNYYKPAIVTTARSGCANAEHYTQYPDGVNGLDSDGKNALAASCQYTAVMNGTSSAAPNVTGVVALMLEANPNLRVRDIKYILAKTAKKVDFAFSGVSSPSVIPGSTITLEQGWVTNAAGWSFSNRYGFGAVDAAAAVSMAKSYTAYLPAVVQYSKDYPIVAPIIVPAYSAQGAYLTFPVSESFNTVESVVVFLNIAYTPDLECNQVELTSPSGTKSILVHAENGFYQSGVNNSRILSNAFYGEPVNGAWTLRFFDFCPASGLPTTLSTTSPQMLGIVGH